MIILRVSIRHFCGIRVWPLVAGLRLLSAHQVFYCNKHKITQSYIKGLITNELQACVNQFSGDAIEDHLVFRSKLGRFESLASKKAVSRDKFGACHVVTGATKSTCLASKKEGYLYRHIAYIVVHRKEKVCG